MTVGGQVCTVDLNPAGTSSPGLTAPANGWGRSSYRDP